MTPTSFDQSNIVYDRPPNMKADECDPLSAYNGIDQDGHPVTITCWKLTKAEVKQLLKTGRLWCITSGLQLIPQHYTTENPFE